MIKLKRAYDPISRTDGRRFLVERLWPRGLTKEKLHITPGSRKSVPARSSASGSATIRRNGIRSARVMPANLTRGRRLGGPFCRQPDAGPSRSSTARTTLRTTMPWPCKRYLRGKGARLTMPNGEAIAAAAAMTPSSDDVYHRSNSASDPIPPFRLDLTVWALRRRARNLVDRWDGTTYRRVVVMTGRPSELSVRQTGTATAPLPRRDDNPTASNRCQTNSVCGGCSTVCSDCGSI